MVEGLEPTALPRVLPPVHQLLHGRLRELQRRDNAHLSLVGPLLLIKIRLYILLLLASVPLNLEVVVGSYFFSEVCRKIGGVTHHIRIGFAVSLLCVHFFYHLLDEFIEDACFELQS